LCCPPGRRTRPCRHVIIRSFGARAAPEYALACLTNAVTAPLAGVAALTTDGLPARTFWGPHAGARAHSSAPRRLAHVRIVAQMQRAGCTACPCEVRFNPPDRIMGRFSFFCRAEMGNWIHRFNTRPASELRTAGRLNGCCRQAGQMVDVYALINLNLHYHPALTTVFLWTINQYYSER
jgi:hypothetical protein